jgi:hypothetical protein
MRAKGLGACFRTGTHTGPTFGCMYRMYDASSMTVHRGQSEADEPAGKAKFR